MTATRYLRLTKARALATHTRTEWGVLVEALGNCCVKCGTEGAIQKDHIVPLMFGGNDGIGNLQPLCRLCHLLKGSTSVDYRPDDWLARSTALAMAKNDAHSAMLAALNGGIREHLAKIGSRGGSRGSPRQQEARRKAAVAAREALRIKRAGIDGKPPQRGEEQT